MGFSGSLRIASRGGKNLQQSQISKAKVWGHLTPSTEHSFVEDPSYTLCYVRFTACTARLNVLLGVKGAVKL